MKFYPKDILKIVNLIQDGQIKAILFYGNQDVVISECVTNLTKTLKYPINKIDYQDLLGLQDYSIALCNLNLFGGKEIIKVLNTPSVIAKNLENFISSENIPNIVIFVAKEMSASSAFRKKQNQFLCSVGCYGQEYITKQKVLDYFAPQKADLKLVQILLNLFGYNESVLNNEVQKIKLLHKDKNILNEEHIIAMPYYLFSNNIDFMCTSLIKKQIKQYFDLVDNHLKNQVPLMLIIRSIQRYYTNLWIVLNDDNSVEQAVAKLNPPIFFKNLKQFIAIASSVDIIYVNYALKVLYKLERYIKNYSVTDYIVLSRLYYSLVE